MQADEVQNAKEPIAAQIDLSGQTLRTPDKTCSELARGKENSLVREVLFAALKYLRPIPFGLPVRS